MYIIDYYITDIHTVYHILVHVYQVLEIGGQGNVRTPGEEVRTFSELSTSSRGWCPRTGPRRLAAEPWAHPPSGSRYLRSLPAGARGRGGEGERGGRGVRRGESEEGRERGGERARRGRVRRGK